MDTPPLGNPAAWVGIEPHIPDNFPVGGHAPFAPRRGPDPARARRDAAADDAAARPVPFRSTPSLRNGKRNAAAPAGHSGPERATPRRAYPRPISLAELLARPGKAPEWLVDGLLLVGGVSLLVAKPKVGKTTLSRARGLAVARGTPFLGRTTQQGAVLYLVLEDSEEMAKEHFVRMGGTAEPLFCHIAGGEEADLEWVGEIIAEFQTRLVIVDTLFKLIRFSDGNDYAQVSRAMAPLIGLARKTRCHITCLHHVGKGLRNGPDAILGSTALFGAVDTVLSLEEHSERGTISTTQRYGTRLPPTPLTLDPATGWPALGTAPATPAEEPLAARVRAVCSAPVTAPALAARLDVSRTRLDRVLARLVAEERLVRVGTGLRGDPYRYAPPTWQSPPPPLPLPLDPNGGTPPRPS
jgi:hypothetical protein